MDVSKKRKISRIKAGVNVRGNQNNVLYHCAFFR